jgi:subfamily B ATP-binding cassette protein HlyB/CyaB
VDRNSPPAAGADDDEPRRLEDGRIDDEAVEQLTPTELRLRAVSMAARFYGVDLDITEYRGPIAEAYPSPASLVVWLRDQGLYAKAMRLTWKNLFRFRDTTPVVLLLKDGTAGVIVGADPGRDVVWLKSPTARDTDQPVAVDRLRLEQAWSGDVIMVKRPAGQGDGEAPFTLQWIFGQVAQEQNFIRQISYASLVLSMLTIVPAFIIMGMIDRVLAFNSLPTFYMLTSILACMMFYEMVLGWARREIILVLSTRLNLHIFARMLALPLDFFERNQAGETLGRLQAVFRVRDFVTGKMLNTLLDGFTLVVIMPFMMYMEPTLGMISIAVAGLIALIILIFLRPIGRLVGLAVRAEHKKSAVMNETVHGIRTVKTLALEPQQRMVWDERVAEAANWRLAAGRLANWPQTMVDPLQLFMGRGIILLGCYLALMGDTNIDHGALIAFMLLSSRVSAPLVGFARLLEDFQEVRTAIGQIAKVLNNLPEVRSVTDGMRPKFEGQIEFDNVTFTYPLGQSPALNKVSFLIPLGQIHRHPSASGHQPRIHRRGAYRRRRNARNKPRASAPCPRRRVAGQFPVPRLGQGQHHGRPPWPDPGRCGARRPPGRGGGIHRAHAARLRHMDRGRVGQHFRRPASAPRHCPRPDYQSAHHDPG